MLQVLPQFIPKATVEFRSVIGVRNRKAIELQNPNKVPIKYNVTLEVRDNTPLLPIRFPLMQTGEGPGVKDRNRHQALRV